MTDELQEVVKRKTIPAELFIPEFRNMLDEIETIQNAVGGMVHISFGGQEEGIMVIIDKPDGRSVTFVVSE